MKKRILSILLCLCMAISLLPTTALAEGETDVASVTIGGTPTGYTDFNLALTAAQGSNGSTLKLLADHSGSVTVSGGEFTLDLNGKTITGTKGKKEGNVEIPSEPGLILKDSANVTLQATGGGQIIGGAGKDEKSTEDESGQPANVVESATCGSTAVYVKDGCTFTVYDGTLKSGAPGSWAVTPGVFNPYYSEVIATDSSGTAVLYGGTYILDILNNPYGIFRGDGSLPPFYRFYDSGNNMLAETALNTVPFDKGTVTVRELNWSDAITYDSGTKTYTVLSADGLRWLSAVSNGTITANTYQNDPAMLDCFFNGYTVKLGANIDLSGQNWTPILNFYGVFDGAGHSVTNMTVDTEVQGGFIKNADCSATVRNLSVSGSVNVTASASALCAAGGIVGVAFATDNETISLENCTANVTVSLSGTENATSASAGGLIGYVEERNNSVLIQNCYSSGMVSNTATSTNEGSYTGALVGYCNFSSGNNVKLTNCYASQSGTLTSSSTTGGYAPILTSVGTYDASGNLTATDGTSLDYGSTLKNAVNYWVNRQDNIGNYVTWTTDNLPLLTTTYAEVHTHTFDEWTKQPDGSYTASCTDCGLSKTAEACVTSGGTETPYATLEEAITAAQSVSGSTVKLMTDVTTDAEVDVAFGTFTIDLNSKTWTGTPTGDEGFALWLNGGNVTMKDSGTNGTFTSVPNSAASGECATLYVDKGSVTIESGIYQIVGGSGYAIWIDKSNEEPIVTISGGTFTSLKTYTGRPVGRLLADGYSYRNTVDSTWVNDINTNMLNDVSVQLAPVKISAQSQDVTVTYGYPDPIVLSVATETVPKNSGKAITYQWHVEGGILSGDLTSASFTVPTGLPVGSETYYCAVTCDGCTVSSKTVTVTVSKATGIVANKEIDGYPTVQTYNGNGVNPDDSHFEANKDGALTFTWYAGQNEDGSITNLSELTQISEPVNAGKYTLKVDVKETINVTAASTTLKVSIDKADPSVGNVIDSGNTLYTSTTPSDVTLISTNNAQGTIVLDGVTALTKGTNTYSWKFTPNDTNNYKIVTGTISLTVSGDTLQSISSSGTPSKTAYIFGDAFDKNGLTVTANYESGATKEIMGSVTASPLAVGDTSVTLSYTEGNVTESCSVSGISVAKKQLDISGMSWSTETAFDFDGNAKSIILIGVLPNGVTVSKSEDTAINAGTYSANATFSLANGYSTDSYEIAGTNPLTASWSIAKATAPMVSEQTKSHIRTVATSGNSALLAGLLPENRGTTTYEVTSISYSGLENVSVSTDGTLKYDTKLSANALTDTITVKATMENYHDTIITVKISLTDKIGVTLTGLSAPTGRIYNGSAVANSDFGTPSFAPNTFNGEGLTYTYYEGNSVSGEPISAPKDAGTYTVRVAIPNDDAAYTGYADIAFTIGKATVVAASDNKSMTTNGTLPTFTVSYTGIVSGDTAESIFVTQATASCAADGKTVGSYPITATTPVLKDEAAKNYTVGASVSGTLTVSNPSTGGSSGGSSSSGGADTVPVSNGSGTVSVSASVSGSTAIVSVTDAQLKEIASGTNTTGTVKIDVSGLKVDTVVVPSKVVSTANTASGSVEIEVILPTGTVTLDKTALAAVSGKGDVKVSVEDVSNSKLTDSQKKVLGTQTSTAVVVDVNVYVNGSKTSTFNDGKIRVSVPYTLKSGENADNITVWFIKDDGTIEPKNGTYNTATGCVDFTTNHLSQYLIVSFPFADVAEDAWYYGSAAYAYNNGLISGTSSTNFSPDTAMTRQMIWMVLARMDGKTPANMEEARALAIENGISDGSAPTSSITREQMAAILYRYATYKKYDTTQGGMTIREFADYNSISEYALPALDWAVNDGLVQGSDNNLMPSGTATRAQVATILQRFSQNVAK